MCRYSSVSRKSSLNKGSERSSLVAAGRGGGILLRLHSYLLQDFLNDGIGPHLLGLAFEIQDEAMAERRGRHLLDVFHGNIEPAIEQRAHLAAEDHGLQPARAGTVLYELLHHGRRLPV